MNRLQQIHSVISDSYIFIEIYSQRFQGSLTDPGYAGNPVQIKEIAIFLTISNYSLCQYGPDSWQRHPINRGHGIGIKRNPKRDTIGNRHFHY